MLANELPVIGRTYYLEDGRAFEATRPRSNNQCTGCAFFVSCMGGRENGCPNPVQDVSRRIAGLPNCLNTNAPPGSQHVCIYQLVRRQPTPGGKPPRKWPKVLPD